MNASAAGVALPPADLMKLVQEYGTARYSEGVSDALSRQQMAVQSHSAAKDRLADIELALRTAGVSRPDGESFPPRATDGGAA